MLNSHDPHRPFYGNDRAEWYEGDLPAASPSRIFEPAEVVTPGFLPDLPDVRREIAEYYSSVRRCDDTVGAAMDVLHDTGAADSTLVLFLSDNGMAFPFAKTNCYLNSTRTPLIVAGPGVAGTGTMDEEHFVSGIDVLPTLLDVAGVPCPVGASTANRSCPSCAARDRPDGSTSSRSSTRPPRGTTTRCDASRTAGSATCFNAWSNGEREFRNESQGGRTMAAMRDAAGHDEHVAARVELFLRRTVEEFYDFQNDPNALVNLAADPAYADEMARLQGRLEEWNGRRGRSGPARIPRPTRRSRPGTVPARDGRGDRGEGVGRRSPGTGSDRRQAACPLQRRCGSGAMGTGIVPHPEGPVPPLRCAEQRLGAMPAEMSGTADSVGGITSSSAGAPRYRRRRRRRGRACHR